MGFTKCFTLRIFEKFTYLKAGLIFRLRCISECIFAWQGEADDVKPKLLPGGFDEAPTENKPERRRNGDIKQALRYETPPL